MGRWVARRRGREGTNAGDRKKSERDDEKRPQESVSRVKADERKRTRTGPMLPFLPTWAGRSFVIYSFFRSLSFDKARFKAIVAGREWTKAGSG